MGPAGKKVTFQCLNIRGLVLASNRVKVDTLSDKLVCDNSMGIMLTETWLCEDMLSAETNIENYDLFRADRDGRQRGGAAIYIKSDLQCKLMNSFSNGVVEVVSVKCKKLDTIYICVYRPPSTSVDEWRQAVSHIENEIDMAHSNSEYGTIVMGGDFNFPKIE